jgi:hypothetical protein
MNRFKSLVVGTIGLAAVAATSAASATLITFSEFAVGTLVSNQYAALGVIFGPGTNQNLPIIANDGAMPGSPVLSPNPAYAGDFYFTFLGPVFHVEFDSGYWDSVGSGVIQVYDAGNNLLSTLTNAGLGVQHIVINSGTAIAKIVFNSARDPAGGDIDNLSFNIPEPGTLVLMGAGLLMAGIGRRTNRRA